MKNQIFEQSRTANCERKVKTTTEKEEKERENCDQKRIKKKRE
jgi:hypothetical protein